MKPVVAIALAVAAFVIGVLVGGAFDPGNGVDEQSAPATLKAENERLEGEVTRLESALEAVRSGVASTGGDPDRAAEPGSGGEEGATAEAGAAAGGEAPKAEILEAPAFFAEEYSGVLKKVDWKTVGTNMSEMSGLIRNLVPVLKNSGQPDPQTIGRIQELNGPLVVAALQVGELPGTGVNGKFTDPTFMVNAMESTLEAAKLPLTPEQAKSLERTARSWMEVDERRRKGYDEETYVLQQLWEEAELKGKFFDDAFALMTPEQFAILSPESSRDRVRLDIFSEALLYSPLSRPLPYGTTDELITEFSRGSIGQFRLKEDRMGDVREIVSSWLSEVPRADLERETSALDLHGLVEVDRVNTWARHIQALLVRLVAELRPDEAGIKRARGHSIVFVPVKRPDGE